MEYETKPGKKRWSRRGFIGAATASAIGATFGVGKTHAAQYTAHTENGHNGGDSSKGGMKITDVRVLQMAANPGRKGSYNWTFVKIETDSGIYGVGEASLQYRDQGIKAEIETYKKFLLGKDPFRIEFLWTSMYRRVTWAGGPVTTSAISAIDLALWDIKGKALGVPVYELAGGRFHDSIKMYANGWPKGDGSPEGYAAGAEKVVNAGYKALKIYPFNGAQVVTPDRIQLGVARVEAVRDAVGPDIEIGIDIRARLNIWSARRVAQELEPFDIAWMEEPVLWDNTESMVEFARSVNVPVATGEQLYTRWGFRELLESNSVGIIQPDICHAGGMTELKKIAAMAATYYVTLAPHNSNGPVSTIASLHLDTSIHNSIMQEVFINHLALYNKVLTHPIEFIDGHWTPSQRPGWGTDLNEEVIRQYPPSEYTVVESEPYREF